MCTFPLSLIPFFRVFGNGSHRQIVGEPARLFRALAHFRPTGKAVDAEPGAPGPGQRGIGRSPDGAGLSCCAPSPGKPGLGPCGRRSLSRAPRAAARCSGSATRRVPSGCRSHASRLVPAQPDPAMAPRHQRAQPAAAVADRRAVRVRDPRPAAGGSDRRRGRARVVVFLDERGEAPGLGRPDAKQPAAAAPALPCGDTASPGSRSATKAARPRRQRTSDRSRSPSASSIPPSRAAASASPRAAAAR